MKKEKRLWMVSFQSFSGTEPIESDHFVAEDTRLCPYDNVVDTIRERALMDFEKGRRVKIVVWYMADRNPIFFGWADNLSKEKFDKLRNS